MGLSLFQGSNFSFKNLSPLKTNAKLKVVEFLLLNVYPFTLKTADKMTYTAGCCQCRYRSGGPRSAVGSASDSSARGPGFDTWSGHILLSNLLLIQEGQYVHLVLINRLGDLSLPRNNVTIAVTALKEIISPTD